MTPDRPIDLLARALAPTAQSVVSHANGVVALEIVAPGPGQRVEIILLIEGDEREKKDHFRAMQAVEDVARQALPSRDAFRVYCMEAAYFPGYRCMLEVCAMLGEEFAAVCPPFSLACSPQPTRFAPGKVSHSARWRCLRTVDLPDEPAQAAIIAAMKGHARALGYPAEAAERLAISFESQEQWDRWEEANFR